MLDIKEPISGLDQTEWISSLLSGRYINIFIDDFENVEGKELNFEFCWYYPANLEDKACATKVLKVPKAELSVKPTILVTSLKEGDMYAVKRLSITITNKSPYSLTRTITPAYFAELDLLFADNQGRPLSMNINANDIQTINYSGVVGEKNILPGVYSDEIEIEYFYTYEKSSVIKIPVIITVSE